jgi:hypothetical protein
MAVSSTAAIIARILTEFRLSGPEEDDAHNTSAEWPFSELRKALRRGFDYYENALTRTYLNALHRYQQIQNRNDAA